MKQFVAVFIGSENSEKRRQWDALSEKEQQARENEGMNAWKNWMKKNEKSIVVTGSPLGSTKKVDSKGVSDTSNQLCAYTVVQANSHEEAAKLFMGHPHFSIFPGDAVEVMECLEIPGT